ncbi:MAG TPA: energy transducer TonB [Bacteroidia bacterium]|nr:energy transducer TonB [Bacteroidia bacterium]
MKKTILISMLFLFGAIFVHAQQAVPAPQKNGFYEEKDSYGAIQQSGMCTNGFKTGTWKYFEFWRLKKEEDFDNAGILIATRIVTYHDNRTEVYTMVNDVHEGKCYSYYSNSHDTIMYGWYTAGKKDRIWNYFRELNGNNLWKNEIWKSGALLEVQFFYADGKLYERDHINESGDISSITYYDEVGKELQTLDQEMVEQKEKDDSVLRANNTLRPPPPPPSLSSSPATSDSVKKPEVFSFVEQMPEFPGGGAALQLFLQQNIHYPEAAKEMGMSGVVYISFRVNKYGGVEGISCAKGAPGTQLLQAEAIRVISMMPPFTPGKQNGREVIVQMFQPVRFQLQ